MDSPILLLGIRPDTIISVKDWFMVSTNFNQHDKEYIRKVLA